METIKSISKVPATDKKVIISELEAIIKKHGIVISKIVITHYFLKYRETLKRKTRIAELKKEIAGLNRKK